MDIKTNGFLITIDDSGVSISQKDYGRDVELSWVELPLFIEQLNVALASRQTPKEAS